MTTFGVADVARGLGFRQVFRRLALVFAVAGLGIVGTRPVSAATIDPVERDAFLNAIAQVETGGNTRAIGRQGERGMFQFNRTTWRLHTKRAFQDAHDPQVAYSVAVRHYEWLFDGFVRNGREPTPYLMAAAWNAGLSRALSGRPPAATRDYARRVVNIVSISRPPQNRPAVQGGILVAGAVN
jgi:hypothetical protein